MENTKKSLIKKIIASFSLLSLLFCFAYIAYCFMLSTSFKGLPPIEVKKNGDRQESMFVSVNIALTDQMLEKWVPNDITIPRLMVDDLPNFQIAVRDVLYYNSMLLMEHISRDRTTTKMHDGLKAAPQCYTHDPCKWWFPSAESKYAEGADNLRSYNASLLDGTSVIYPRADNLKMVIDRYISLLGDINTRLTNAKRKVVISTETEGDINVEEEVKNVDVSIPWMKIDDNFYYGKGLAYAMLYSMKALQYDFAVILKKKNGMGTVAAIIQRLEFCDTEINPDIVCNNALDSVFANHSIALVGLLQDVRAKMSSLANMLKDG